MNYEPCPCAMNCGPHTREFHAKGGRRYVELYGPPGTLESRKKAGFIGGHIGARKRNELYGPPGTPEGHTKGGRRYIELYGPLGTSEGRAKGGRNQPREAKARGARIGGRIGGPASARAMARMRPHIPEAIVWSYLKYDFGVHEMVFQPKLLFPNAGQPDFRVNNLLGEFDGGGHHAFRDRTKKDAEFDAIRAAHGYMVIRETDPWILAAKLAVG